MKKAKSDIEVEEKKPVGRPKNLESPEKLFEYFRQYMQYVEENPVEKLVTGNKNFIISRQLTKRPLTFEGFEIWCFENGIISDLMDYFKNKEGRYTDFAPVCLIIKKYIRKDQIDGGMTGIYNHSITQRLNGLVEKTSITDEEGKSIPLTPVIVFQKSEDQLKESLNQLNDSAK